MKKHCVSLITMLVLSLFAQHVSAQLSFDWFAQNDDLAASNRMQQDATGKVYALKNVGGVPGTLIKFNTNGGVAWSVNYALTSPSGDDKLIVDGAGNAYVAYYGTCDPNCNRIIGHLKKFNVNGVLVWDDTLAGRSGTSGTQIGLAIDASGNLLLGITIDIAVSPPAIPAVEIAKYSSNGTRLWKLSDIYPTLPYRGPLKGFSCDQFGNVYAARINAVTNRPHLLKCSGSGFFQYDKELASGNAVSYSQFDAVYDQASSSIFCVYEKNDGAGDSIFMLRADPVNNGDVLWTQKKLNNGFFTSIQIDGFGNVYWELNDGGFQIQKYNATGTYQFSLPDGGGRLAFDASNNIYSCSNLNFSKYSSSGAFMYTYFDGVHEAYGLPLFNSGTNQIFFVARENANGHYGLIRYSVCSCTYTATSVITNTTGAVCNNGKIKINFTGSFSYYPHLELYDENDVLLTSVNKGQAATSHTFSNLSAGNYTVKVFDKSCCEQDFTLQVKCPKPDAGLAVTNITSTSARTNWTTLPCAAGYRVQYRKQGTTAWANKFVNTNTGFKVLTGLLPATTYEWRIQTTCIIGTPAVYSAFSAIQTFTTSVMRKGGEDVASQNLQAVDALRVYPHPSENELHVMFKSNDATAHLKIVSSTGQIIFDNRVNAEDGNYTEQVDISKLKKGLYMLLVQTHQGAGQKTFVKQ